MDGLAGRRRRIGQCESNRRRAGTGVTGDDRHLTSRIGPVRRRGDVLTGLCLARVTPGGARLPPKQVAHDVLHVGHRQWPDRLLLDTEDATDRHRSPGCCTRVHATDAR